MDRLIRFNVVATSGRAVEAAGDVDTLLLDKTGTITFGNRQATEVIPVPGVIGTRSGRGRVAGEPCRRDRRGPLDRHPDAGEVSRRRPTPERARRASSSSSPRPRACPASIIGGRKLRKGAVDAVLQVRARAGRPRRPRAAEFRAAVDRIARSGGTPLGLADGERLLGVIHLKDVVKADIKERFAEMRRMGIRTVMVTGDNPVTAAAIASEAGVDDFIAEATPEDKLRYIRDEQAKGRLIAMCGDGTNDAPALAQADVGVAMQTGTQPAREAGNMVDLDSDPTKLIEVVEIGKQLLMTRGSLTTFSIANDVAKYFAIIPALFVVTYPQLQALNVMALGDAEKRDPVRRDLQCADHRRPDPAGAARRRPIAPVGAAALLRRNLLDLRAGRHPRAVHRHQARRPHRHRARPRLKEAVHAHPSSSRARAARAVHGAHRHRLSAGDDRHRAGCAVRARRTAA